MTDPFKAIYWNGMQLRAWVYLAGTRQLEAARNLADMLGVSHE